jgi:hypothetical protein
MKTSASIVRAARIRLAVGSLAVIGTLSGCALSDAPAGDETSQSSSLASVDGRGVSASETELVIRTADGERVFQVKPEDVGAVDPDHFNSHVGVATLAYRIYFREEGGVEYAVSVEEIDGTTLDFD